MAPRWRRCSSPGGAGFIGSNLVRALLERGDDVRVLDNFSTGNRANLEGLDVEVVEGELRSYERVHNAVRGVEVVFHLGALGSVPRSVQDPLTSSAVNVEGTLNVLLAARDEGVRRVVFSSSSSVYGSQRDAAARRGGGAPTRSRRTASRKLAAERYCVAFSRVYEGFETVVVRYFNVFGPRQSPRSQYAAVVPLFLTAIAEGRAGHDLRRRRAVARLHLRRQRRRRDAAGGGHRRASSGRIFNVASERAGERERARGDDRPHPRQGGRRGRRRRRARATSATPGPTSPPPREALGWEPPVGLEEGLAPHRRVPRCLTGSASSASSRG